LRNAATARCTVTAIAGFDKPIARAASSWFKPDRNRSAITCWYRSFNEVMASRITSVEPIVSIRSNSPPLTASDPPVLPATFV